jgi:hypothetical protein
MRLIGIGLLLTSALLCLGSCVGPMFLSLGFMAAPEPARPAELSTAVLIPLVGLPAAALAAVAGIVLLVAGMRPK